MSGVRRFVALLGDPVDGLRFRGPYDDPHLCETENEGDQNWLTIAPIEPTVATKGLSALEVVAYELLCEEIAEEEPSDLGKSEYDAWLRGQAIRLAKQLQPVVEAFEMTDTEQEEVAGASA